MHSWSKALCLLAVGNACLASILPLPAAPAPTPDVSGELRQWHPITLSFAGPEAAEDGSPNPFRDYRMDVTFEHPDTGDIRVVPGFFAADGKAAETSADRGNCWRVHFSPPGTGQWRWSVSFRAGPDVAMASDPRSGSAWLPLDGASGTLDVAASDKRAPDFRARGHLEYVGARYLRFAGDGSWFLKTGVNSPETMLGFADFDGTYRDLSTSHRPPAPNGIINLPSLRNGVLHFEPHAGDWRTGDPTWRGDRGKNLIGGLNYIANQGVNSAYFVTMNVNGDGRNVWPWIAPGTRDRYDCSKLDQWDIVFSHMTWLGLQLHIVTQETENDQLLDFGNVGPERKLYYRELIARFAHHPAVTWNLGEENVQSTAQQLACAAWIRRLNPYRQHIVIHNDHWHAKNLHETFDPLVGQTTAGSHGLPAGELPVSWLHSSAPLYSGTSIQDFYWNDVHEHVVRYVRQSAQSGTPWVVGADELGGAEFGTLPDMDDAAHDDPRRFGLWGTLMGGGAGVEWYFGWQNNSPTSDLSAQDWHSREAMYHQARIAREFFERELPFHRMLPQDERIRGGSAWCLAAPGEIYAIYFPNGGGTRFDLGDDPAIYEVKWFNPRSGGALQVGNVPQIRGPGLAWTGLPPAEHSRDWLAVVRRLPEPTNTMLFPQQQWTPASPLEAGIDPTGFHHALNRWRLHTGPQGMDRTVIIRRGRMVHEGRESGVRQDIRSATKSFTSTVFGLLIDSGAVRLDSPASSFEPSLREHYSAVTLRDFATMTSGYSAAGASRWNEPSEDWSTTPYQPARPMFAPGSQFAYWDEAQMMFARVLTRAAREDMLGILKNRVLDPIGVRDVTWVAEGDLNAVPVRNGCTGLEISAQDLARFGHLFLNEGRWESQQLIPSTWVHAATSVQVPSHLLIADTDRKDSDGAGVYGFNWWVNGIDANGDRFLRDAPPGTFFALGRHHNVCVVIPEWEMVIVRMGDIGHAAEGAAETLNGFLRRLGDAVYPLPPLASPSSLETGTGRVSTP